MKVENKCTTKSLNNILHVTFMQHNHIMFHSWNFTIFRTLLRVLLIRNIALNNPNSNPKICRNCEVKFKDVVCNAVSSLDKNCVSPYVPHVFNTHTSDVHWTL